MPACFLHVFFEKRSIQILWTVFNWLIWFRFFFFWLLSYMSSSHILDTNPLSDIELANIFSQSVGCLFILLERPKFLTHYCVELPLFLKSLAPKITHMCSFLCYIIIKAFFFSKKKEIFLLREILPVVKDNINFCISSQLTHQRSKYFAHNGFHNYAWEIQGRIPKFTSAIHIQSENNYMTLCEACFKKRFICYKSVKY